MRILMISPLPLFPNSSGATERILNIIYFLANKGHEITIALPYMYVGTESDYDKLKVRGNIRVIYMFSKEVFSPSTEKSSRSVLKRLRDLIPFNVTIFSPSAIARLYIETAKNRPNAIIGEFDGSWLLGYILSGLIGSSLIIDKHNLESILYYRSIKQAGPKLTPLQKVRFYVVLMVEKFIWTKSTGTIVVSQHDYTVSQQLFGRKENLRIALNGTDTTTTIQAQSILETRKWLFIPLNSKIIVFHGLGTYGPNIEARKRLINTILPLTRKLSKDDVYAVIVGPGNAPISKVQSYSKVRLVGEVPKKQLHEIICSSDVAVVPLRSGSGTRLKILDYFNARVPVVATALAAEGLPIKDGRDILIRDDDLGIVQAIVRVFSENQLDKNLTQNAWHLIKEKLSWDTTLEPIEELALQLSFDAKKGTEKDRFNSRFTNS